MSVGTVDGLAPSRSRTGASLGDRLVGRHQIRKRRSERHDHDHDQGGGADRLFGRKGENRVAPLECGLGDCCCCRHGAYR